MGLWMSSELQASDGWFCCLTVALLILDLSMYGSLVEMFNRDITYLATYNNQSQFACAANASKCDAQWPCSQLQPSHTYVVTGSQHGVVLDLVRKHKCGVYGNQAAFASDDDKESEAAYKGSKLAIDRVHKANVRPIQLGSHSSGLVTS